MKLEQHFSKDLNRSLYSNGIKTLPSTNHYLTRMMLKFIDSEKLFVNSDPILIELMKAENKPEKLNDVGDRCLFLTGYFYDSLRKMGKGFVDYHYDVGRSAFGNLAGISRLRQSREMYGEMCRLFQPLSIAIGDLHLSSLGEKDLINIYSKWVTTKDDRYKHTLNRLGVVIREGN